MTILSLENIRKEYREKNGSKTKVLSSVDITINERDVVGISGVSASGKSTLLKIMSTLLRPDDGTIELFGTNLLGLRDADISFIRANKIGIIPQDCILIDSLSVNENVEIPLYFSNHKVAEFSEKVDRALSFAGVEHLKKKSCRGLSGGERQRVAVARAIVNDPDLIIADEPTSSLDSSTKDIVFNLFASFHNAGKTLIIATHDKDMLNICNRKLVLQDGKLHE